MSFTLNLISRLKDEDVSAAELGLFVHLAEYRNAETGLCCPTQEELAETCDLSRPTVRKYLRKGEELGLYTIVKEFNPKTLLHFNRYEWSQTLIAPRMEKRDPSRWKNEDHKPMSSSPISIKRKKDQKVAGFGGADFPSEGKNGDHPPSGRVFTSLQEVRDLALAGK